jgi:hypothetical protein
MNLTTVGQPVTSSRSQRECSNPRRSSGIQIGFDSLAAWGLSIRSYKAIGFKRASATVGSSTALSAVPVLLLMQV